MAYLKNCCGCASLRAGTIITGIIDLTLVAVFILIIILTNAKVKTIIWEDISPILGRIILGLNVFMIILISILLIVGAVKYRRYLVLPWIILAVVLAVGFIISLIITSVRLFSKEDVVNGILTLAVGLSVLGIHIYLWLVVLSFFQQVKESRLREQY